MNAFSQRFDLIEADIPEGIKSLKKGLLLAADYSLITKNLGENRGLCLCRLQAAHSHHYPKQGCYQNGYVCLRGIYDRRKRRMYNAVDVAKYVICYCKQWSRPNRMRGCKFFRRMRKNTRFGGCFFEKSRGNANILVA